MAVTAREVLLVFRAQNYMSGAMRRIGADVGGLSRSAQLANQRAQLNINQQRLQRTRSIAQTEVSSIGTGTRALSLQKARLALSKEEFNNAQNLRRNYEAQLGNQSQLLKNQNTQTMLQRRMSGQSVMKGEFGGMNQAELQKAYQAAQIEQERLLNVGGTLRRQEEMLTGAMGEQSLAAQKVAASEAEMYQRQAQLVQQINTTNEAITLNTEKLRQNRLAQQQLKFENFASGAAKVEHAGRAVQMFGIITGAAMGYAADQAAKFNTQATIAAAKVKQPGMTVAQIQQNANQIQARLTKLLTSGQAVVSPQDLTTGVYRTLSGLQLPGNRNAQIREAVGLVKQFQAVVKANFGMTDLDQVTQAAITTMRDFGFSVKNVGGALNTMQAAEKYGRMTMGEFLSTFNQAAPAARSAGYSFKDMAGTIAYLSTKFPSVQTAATGYARLLQTLAQNATKFNQAGYQITNKAGTQLLPLDQIIASFIKKTPQLAKGGVVLQNFFKQVTGQTGYIQARRVFTFLAQDLGGLDKVTKQVAGDQTVLAKSVRAAAESPGVKWEEFKNQLRGIVLVLGAGAIPAFKAFAAPIIAAIKWFDTLNPRTQKFIGYMIAMIGIGAALGGTLAAVTGGLARIGSVLAAGLFAKVGEEAGFASVKFSLMLGAIGLLSLAFFKFHSQTMSVINALGGFKVVLAGAASFAIAKTLINIASAMYKVRDAEVAVSLANPFLLIAVAGTMAAVVILTKWNQVKQGWITILAFMYGFFMKFVNSVIDLFNNMLNVITGGLAGVFHLQAGHVGEEGPFAGFMDALQRRAESLKAAQNLMKDAAKTGVPAPFGVFRRAHPDEPKKQAEADYKQYRDHMLKVALKTVPPRPLTPPPGSSPAVMKHYQQQMRTWEAVKRAIDQTNTKVKHLTKSQNDATSAAKLYGTDATAAFKKAYDMYVKALKAAKADPTDIQKQIAAQNALMNLQQVSSKQQIAAAKKAADATVSANKTIAASSQITFQSVLDSIQGMYNQLLQTEQTTFGQLFQGPFSQSPAQQNFTAWGGKPTGQMLAKDLRSQVHQFRQFHHDLNRLQRQGAPSELIQQLMDLGPSALPQIQALLKMGSAGLQNYFKMFRQSQRMIHEQTMKDLRAQLNQYRKYGQQIALAIVAGLQDQNKAVENSLKKMIHEMFPGLGGHAAFARPTTHAGTRQGHAHAQHHAAAGETHRGHIRRYYRRRPPSPPLHTRQPSAFHPHNRNTPQFVDYVRNQQFPLTQSMTTQATVNALNSTRHLFKQHYLRDLKAAQPIKVYITGWNKNNTQQGEIHQHDHYHLDMPKGSSIDTQVRHSHFRVKNKHPRKKFTGDRYNL